MSGVEALSTAPAPSGDRPAAQRRDTRARLLGMVTFVLVVAACIMGGLMGSGRLSGGARRKPAPVPFDSADIIDALMVGNEMRRNANETTPAGSASSSARSSSSSATAAATTIVTPSTAANATTKGSAPSSSLTNPIDAIKAMFGGGGSTAGARPMAAQLVTQPTADGIPAGAVITQSWKQLEGSGRSVICYPNDGMDVEHMIGADSPCNVLVLRNGPEKEYMVSKTLNVSTPKVILGQPAIMPVLNCTRPLERLFDVKPGGKLDVRFVVLVRGFGRQVGAEREVRLTLGSIALVRVGGYMTFSGCLLRERPNRASNWLEEIRSTIRNPATRSINLGQLILALGGNVRVVGCRLLRFRPFGNGVFLNIIMGGDMLVVAGNGQFIGCLWYSASLYSPLIWRSGSAMAVLGGTGLLIGGNMYGATCAQIDVSWGAHLFVAAGVMVTVGWGRVSANLNLVRINGGQFSCGTGAFLQIGLNQARAWAPAGIFGPGQSYANAAGIYFKVLSTFVSWDVVAAFMGVGGSMYVGAGTHRYIQVARVSAGVARTTYGCGSTIFNGGGYFSQIYVDQASIAAARWMAGVGSDWFLGGGFALTVNHTRFGYNVVNAFTGAGGQAFVGLGAAVWVRSYSYSARVKNWNTCPYTFTVAGMGTRKVRGANYLITKNGLSEFKYNKTDKTLTRSGTAKTQKTRAPSKAPSPSKFDKRRRMPVMKHKRARRRYMVADLSDVAKFSWLGEAVKATNALPFEVPNKAVFLASTIAESVRAPPSLEDFQTLEGKKGFGGYLTKWAEVLKRDLDPASLQAGASALGGGREMRERPAVIITPGKVSVNNSDCFMCRVGPGATADHVGGPAACEVNDACEGMGPLEVAAAAQGQTQQDLSFPQSRYMPYVDEEGELQNSDVGLFWHELTVYCRPTDGATESDVTEGCLDRAYIKGLVMEYMGADVSKLADVAVSQMNVHDAVKPFVVQLDPDGELDTALAPEWSPECQGWSKFNVYVTTTYADAAAAVKEIWAEIVADPTTFSDAVVSNAAAAGADAELLPCFVTVERKAATTFPSLNKWPSFKPSRELGLAPSLTIGSATAIVPVESLVAGRQYTLFLQNFPQNSQIDIVLKDGTGAASVFDAAGVGSQQVLVAAIDAFDDEDGIEEVAWTAPHTPGRYFLQAFPTNVPALFATSTVFSIVDPEEAAGGEHEEHIGQRRRYHRW